MHAVQEENQLSIAGLTNFLDLIPELALLIDTFGKIHYAGHACINLTGYNSHDLQGKILYQFIDLNDTDSLKKELHEGSVLGSKIGIKTHFLHQQKVTVFLQWSVKWLPQERLMLCIAREVTQDVRRPVMERGLAHASAPLALYEKRVLELLLTDASEKQIADRLGLTVSTTHSYITGIFRKFRVRGRAGLMSLWIHTES